MNKKVSILLLSTLFGVQLNMFASFFSKKPAATAATAWRTYAGESLILAGIAGGLDLTQRAVRSLLGSSTPESQEPKADQADAKKPANSEAKKAEEVVDTASVMDKTDKAGSKKEAKKSEASAVAPQTWGEWFKAHRRTFVSCAAVAAPVAVYVASRLLGAETNIVRDGAHALASQASTVWNWISTGDTNIAKSAANEAVKGAVTGLTLLGGASALKAKEKDGAANPDLDELGKLGKLLEELKALRAENAVLKAGQKPAEGKPAAEVKEETKQPENNNKMTAESQELVAAKYAYQHATPTTRNAKLARVQKLDPSFKG